MCVRGPNSSQKKQQAQEMLSLPYPLVWSCFQKDLCHPRLYLFEVALVSCAGQMSGQYSTQHLTGQPSQANRKACWAWAPQDAGSSSASLYSGLWVLLWASACRKGPWGLCSCAQQLFHLCFPRFCGQLSLPAASGGWPHRTPAPVPDSLPLKTS